MGLEASIYPYLHPSTINLLKLMFHRLKIDNFNSVLPELSQIWLCKWTHPNDINMAVTQEGSSAMDGMSPHYTTIFYSIQMSFCGISPHTHAYCLKSLVSCTKQMRSELWLSSPSFSLLQLHGAMSLLSSTPTNRRMNPAGKPVGSALCQHGLPFVFRSWWGHQLALISLVCQAKL